MPRNTIRLQISNAYNAHSCDDILCQLCNKRYWRSRIPSNRRSDFQATKPQSEKLHRYLDRIIRRVERNFPIYLAVVGKDPYRTGPIGIPFAKSTLDATFATDSGKVLFPALGIQIENWIRCERDVIGFYDELCNRGIVFLNVSYKFIGDDFVKSRQLQFLKCANLYNKPILETAENVVLCGKAEKGTKWANSETLPYYTNALKPWHPSASEPSSNASQTKKNNYLQKWKPYWGGSGNLLRMLEPNDSGPIHEAIREMNELVQ